MLMHVNFILVLLVIVYPIEKNTVNREGPDMYVDEYVIAGLVIIAPVSYTHLTLPTIYSV